MLQKIAVISGDEVVEETSAHFMTAGEFELFYSKHARSLIGYLHRITGNYALAEDLLQKAFLQLLTTPLRSDNERQTRGFLGRIATNLALDELRKRKRRGEEEIVVHAGAGRTDADHLRVDLERAFGELEPKERSFLWLAHVEGSDHAEIAKATGVAKGSVKVLLHRARKKLETILRRRGILPGELK